MKPEHVLPVLYDLTLTIGREVQVRPLLTRVLQRLLFHTSFPAGLVLLHEVGGETGQCMAALGDRALTSRVGQPWDGPPLWRDVDAGWLDAITVQALGASPRLRCALCLPVPDCGAIVLLAPQVPASEQPLAQVLAPVLRNLAQAIELCRVNEALTQRLQDDRDQARSDLAAALQDSEAQRRLLRLLTDTLPDLFWLKDLEGRYLFCNPGFERLYGAREAQILGRTDGDFVDDDLAAAFRAHDQAALEANAPRINEEWLSFPDNGYRGLFETVKVPVRGGDGQPMGILGVARDITMRRRNEQQLQLAASVFTHAREGIMITDAAGTILDVNATFTLITGYTRDEALGRTPRLLQSGRQSPEFYAQMWRELRRHGHWSGELWNRRRNGELYPELLTISSITDVQGQVQHYVALFSDVSKQKEHERQLERIAHYDVLTQLPNRVLLADRLQQGMVQARRRGQVLAVAYLDLDGFKAINDAHGHSAGDRFLTAVAERMARALRESDTLARLGGDEFVAVLHDLDSEADAEPLLQRLLQAVRERVDLGGQSLQASTSIGVTFYRGHEDIDADQLMRQADQAMYQAKLSGKNRCYTFDPEQDRDVRGRHEHLQQIAQALEAGEFELHYQPKVNLRSGTLVGVEALIRWRHPQRGLLSPALFLPVIEQHPLAVAVGEWVIEAALRQIEAWRAAGRDIAVSVNIGASHLQQRNFVERLAALLAQHPAVPPALLEIEIVETSALHDISQVSGLLEACADLGVRCALDDFGTGYSSLSYLKRLPAYQLKIDQSFVRDMLDDPDDLAILEGVMGLARAFGREVIAEGVETVEHGEMLLHLGCELGQGYGIAAPMPAAELLPWVARWRPDARWMRAARLDTEQVSVVRASMDLRVWVGALDAYLDGRREHPPELNACRCQLGLCLQKAAQASEAHTDADLAEIDRSHLRVHDLGRELVALHDQGLHGEMPSLRTALYAERDGVLDRLTRWSHLAG